MLVLRSAVAFHETRAKSDLAAESVRGGALTMAAESAQFLLMLGGTAILARLLSPDDFGLTRMALVVVAVARLLAEGGLSTVTVQRRTLTSSQCSFLFWVNVLLAGAFAASVAAASPIVARFFGRQELVWITILLSLSLVLRGISFQHGALLRRNMVFKGMAIIQVGFQVAYLVAATALAILGHGYWSLIWAEVVAAATESALTFAFCRWLPSRPRRAEEASALVRFGRDVLGFNLMNFISINADNVLIGRFLGAGQLGLYSRAYNFFLLPMVRVRNPLQRVGLPALLQLHEQPDRYRRYYSRLVNVAATLSVPIGLMCAVKGTLIIRILLGEQWLDAVPVLRVLGLVMIIQPAVTTMGLVQLSRGESRRYFGWSLVTTVVHVGSFVAGLSFGITGVAAAYAIANYLMLLPTAFFSFASSPVHVRDFFRELLIPISLGGGTMLLALLIAGLITRAPGQDTLGLAIFLLSYSGLSLARPSIRQIMRLLASFRRVTSNTIDGD